MDTVEPATGLTPREKKALQETWSRIVKDKKENGARFFIKFFTMFPKMQDYFPFKTIPLDKLADSARFKIHHGKVMTGVTTMIDNLDNVPELVNIIQKLGKDHYTNGIQSVDFENLEKAFLAFVFDVLGESITDLEKTSWEKVFGVITKVAQSGYQQAKSGE